MKTFLRVTIVLIILAVFGFGVYAIFFKPANKDEVFIALSKIHSDERITHYNLMLESIDGKHFNPEELTLTKDEIDDGKTTYTADNAKTYQDVLTEYRDILLVGDNEFVDVDSKYYDFPTLKEKVDVVFNYYFAYSQAVTGKVSKTSAKKVKNAIKDYQTAYAQLEEKFKSIESLQNQVELNKKLAVAPELASRYRVAIDAFRNYIHHYVVLVEQTSVFVTENVFDGEIIADRDSLLYDLMIKSLKNATATEADAYEYEDVENGNHKFIVASRMQEATKFINFAQGNKESLASNFYHYKGNSILYGNKIYTRKSYLRIPNIQFKVDADNGLLLFPGSEIALTSSGSLYSVGAASEPYVNFFGSKYNVSSSQIETGEGIEYVINIPNILLEVGGTGEDQTLKMYFYKDFCDGSGDATGELITTEFEISGTQITFKDGDSSVVVTTSLFNPFALDSASLCDVSGDGKVVKYYCGDAEDIELSSDVVGEAKYYKYDFYAKTAYNFASTGSSAGLNLNYDGMINAYKNVLKENPDEIDKLMKLTLEDKNKFVGGDPAVSAQFVETLQSDLRYILVCFDFIGNN